MKKSLERSDIQRVQGVEHQFTIFFYTVDGSKIRRSPVEVGRLSHYFYTCFLNFHIPGNSITTTQARTQQLYFLKIFSNMQHSENYLKPYRPIFFKKSVCGKQSEGFFWGWTSKTIYTPKVTKTNLPLQKATFLSRFFPPSSLVRYG